MQITITDEQLEDIEGQMNDLFTVIDDYSGRAMYGRQCVAFEFDGSVATFAMKLGQSLAYVFGDDVVVDWADAAQVDQMGRGHVIYFPGVTLKSTEGN